MSIENRMYLLLHWIDIDICLQMFDLYNGQSGAIRDGKSVKIDI